MALQQISLQLSQIHVSSAALQSSSSSLGIIQPAETREGDTFNLGRLQEKLHRLSQHDHSVADVEKKLVSDLLHAVHLYESSKHKSEPEGAATTSEAEWQIHG